MKKTVIAFMFLFFSASFLKAGALDSLDQANRYYLSDDFARAIESYENLINQGYEPAALYYNLGNAHYKRGNLARAILNYERALLLAPNDEDIRFNLELVNQ
ncbi:MAG TPA: tetratricopeptide repeat protein, partial [Prolixibacteraceae bacterium]|nr:tetratricopeptide repeat protein [Prolixibacteraceae bacterium]